MQKSNSTSALEQVPQPLGPRIRVAREHAGLSLSETARKLGVNESTLSAWESGEEEPRASRLQMLAGLLNVSLPWFLEGREDGHMASRGHPEDEALRAQLAEIRARLDEIQRLVSEAEDRLASRAR